MLRKLILEIICAFFLILFIYTGINKLIHYAEFRFQLGRSPYLQPVAGLASLGLPLGELLVVLLLMFKRFRLTGLLMAYFLMTLFTIYIYSMLNYSYYIPCSCGGVLTTLSWKDHLLFNIVFIVLAFTGILLLGNLHGTNKAHQH